MRILIVRHAKSYYDWNLYPTDAVRPLSDKGRERQIKASKTMERKGLTFSSIWVSPYKRAQETLDIIINQYKCEVPITIEQELVPGGDEEVLYKKLQTESQKRPDSSLLLVGHNPTLSALLEYFESEKIIPELKTSEVAVCDITATSSKIIAYFERSELVK